MVYNFSKNIYWCHDIDSVQFGSTVYNAMQKIAQKQDDSHCWRGCFDFENSLITATNQVISHTYKIAQKKPIMVLSLCRDEIPKKILDEVTEAFLQKTHGIKALTEISNAIIVKHVMAINTNQNKISGTGDMIDGILRLAPLWSIATAAAFLSWLGSNMPYPEQIHNIVNTNPRALIPKVQEFQQVITPGTSKDEVLEPVRPNKQVTQIMPEIPQIDPIVTPTSGQVNIEDWVEKVIQRESSGNPRAVSPVGARGLMQIMPDTWKEATKKIYGKELSFDLAFDPEINRKVGTYYLKEIQKILRNWMKKEPTVDHILSAYNGGIGALRKRNFDVSKMPSESRTYVDVITNQNQAPKNKKRASKNKFYEDDWDTHISDTDRYNTDRYDISLSIRESDESYSIGLQVNSAHVGVAVACEYWHFNKSESKIAKRAFEDIKNAIKKVREEIERERLTFALVSPKFRKALVGLYNDYKEKTGVSLINSATKDQHDIEGDWRNSLYRGQYPDYKRERIKDERIMNNDERTRDVAIHGNSSRGKTTHYRYASTKETVKNLITTHGLHWGKIASSLNDKKYTTSEISAINAEFLSYFYHIT